jgi:hypothetical protein
MIVNTNINNSDRNRPETLRNPGDRVVTTEPTLATGGAIYGWWRDEAAEVAERHRAAIKNNQLYVLTHKASRDNATAGASTRRRRGLIVPTRRILGTPRRRRPRCARDGGAAPPDWKEVGARAERLLAEYVRIDTQNPPGRTVRRRTTSISTRAAGIATGANRRKRKTASHGRLRGHGNIAKPIVH